MAFHYSPSLSDKDYSWNDDSDSENIPSKKKPRLEANPSLDNSYLVAHVTSSNLSRDTLFLSRPFSRSNGLNERCCEIELMNPQGKLWTSCLKYNRSNDVPYIIGGWRMFCLENGLKVDSFHKFKLVRNGTKPLLLLCSNTNPEGDCSKPKEKDHVFENPRSLKKQNMFLKVTFKPYMLTSGHLYLPRKFVNDNGIKEAEEITLMDKNGLNWPLYVAYVNDQRRFYVARGCRSFLVANRFKTGESFTLEFIRREGKTPMLKFFSRDTIKIEQIPIDLEEEATEETETRFEKMARGFTEGGPSRCTRASNRSSTDPINLHSKEPTQALSINDHVTKVKQSLVETLAGVKQFQSVLEMKKLNLEALLQNIDALGEKGLDSNKIHK